MLLPFLLALSPGVAASAPAATPPQASAASDADNSEAESRVDELARLHDEARAAQQSDRLEEARALVREALELLEREPVELDATGIDVVAELGLVAWRAQSVELVQRAFHRVVMDRERTLPDDDPKLLQARSNLAVAMHEAGNLTDARALQENVLAAYERTLPEDHPRVVGARASLASTMSAMGELSRARALQEAVLEARERTLPDDHPDLVRARGNLAVTKAKMDDLDGARALFEAVLATYERTLPEDHPELVLARANLGATMRQAGDLAGARALQEAVLAAYERTLPKDHPKLLTASANLAVTLRRMRELERALALQEEVLASRTRTLPDDHPLVVTARGHLAVTRADLGDLAGARALQEAVLATYERTLPEDHPELLMARANLATILNEMGDLRAARTLQEETLAAYERTLPEDHPKIHGARANLVISMGKMGDLAGARALQEAVLAAHERTLPEGHPELVRAQGHLAILLAKTGELAEARALQEALLEAAMESLPEDHPDLVRARGSLAVTMADMGELQGSRLLQEAVLTAQERTLPGDHPDLLTAHCNLAVTLARLEAWDDLSKEAAALTRAITARLVGGLAGSSRAANENARTCSDQLSLLLFLAEAPGAPAHHGRETFETIELARHVATTDGLRMPDEGAKESLARLHVEASTLRERLSDLVAREGSSPEGFARLVLQRDQVEARIRQHLRSTGAFLERVDAGTLAAALPERSAAVGYWHYTRHRLEGDRLLELRGEDCLLAHVLLRDGTLLRVELGTVDEIDALVGAWRSAVGKPLERGVALEKPKEHEEDAAAHALAERVLAPVLDAAGDDVTTLFVCLDDALHLVPLDALPLPGRNDGGERLVGEALDLRLEVSFARLLREPPEPDGEPELVALGGASFNSSPAPTGDGQDGDDATPVEASTDRAGPGGQVFGPLRETRYEAENLAELFDEVFEREATVLTRKDATKDALRRHAEGARWLHVATHGYFAPESVRSTADPESNADALWTPMTAEERVTGLAPMTLCGLALAGANLGRDSLGRVPGILTAEELAGWDLSQCELAVLSACETNVGVTRAGQGIQSLQAALHMAGARASITSLWKVDDELTRKLMEDLYTRLWVNGEPKAEALWHAKTALRGQGAATRDWAGWVLVGDPD